MERVAQLLAGLARRQAELLGALRGAIQEAAGALRVRRRRAPPAERAPHREVPELGDARRLLDVRQGRPVFVCSLFFAISGLVTCNFIRPPRRHRRVGPLCVSLHVLVHFSRHRRAASLLQHRRPLSTPSRATFSSAMAYTGRDSKISNVIWSPFATSRATRSASWNPSSTSGSSAARPCAAGRTPASRSYAFRPPRTRPSPGRAAGRRLDVPVRVRVRDAHRGDDFSSACAVFFVFVIFLCVS